MDIKLGYEVCSGMNKNEAVYLTDEFVPVDSANVVVYMNGMNRHLITISCLFIILREGLILLWRTWETLHERGKGFFRSIWTSCLSIRKKLWRNNFQSLAFKNASFWGLAFSYTFRSSSFCYCCFSLSFSFCLILFLQDVMTSLHFIQSPRNCSFRPLSVGIASSSPSDDAPTAMDRLILCVV